MCQTLSIYVPSYTYFITNFVVGVSTPTIIFIISSVTFSQTARIIIQIISQIYDKKKDTKLGSFFIKLGRVMGFEPMYIGTTIRGLNHLTTPAISFI